MCFGELLQWFLFGGEPSFDMLLGPKARLGEELGGGGGQWEGSERSRADG